MAIYRSEVVLSREEIAAALFVETDVERHTIRLHPPRTSHGKRYHLFYCSENTGAAALLDELQEARPLLRDRLKVTHHSLTTLGSQNILTECPVHCLPLQPRLRTVSSR